MKLTRAAAATAVSTIGIPGTGRPLGRAAKVHETETVLLLVLMMERNGTVRPRSTVKHA
jgi:hypothetical protein